MSMSDAGIDDSKDQATGHAGKNCLAESHKLLGRPGICLRLFNYDNPITFPI
jgi:hypothetical protein